MPIRMISKFLTVVLLCSAIGSVQAERLKDLAVIAGQRSNQLIGYGLVVGLDGTGDNSGPNLMAGQSIVTMLSALGVSVPPNINLQTRNVAAAMVTAELPALARPGQVIDVTVSSLGNARSLKGGTLLMTLLRAANGQVYGQAQGSVVVPGAALNTAQSRTLINQQAAGRIPSGGTVEQAAPSAEVGLTVEFNFRKADFAQTQKAVEVLARVLGADAVAPLDAKTVAVRVPTDPVQRMSVMAQLQELEIPSVVDAARVVINARTGSVVINQAVQMAPFAVTHGNVTIRVQAANPLAATSVRGRRGAPVPQGNERVFVDQGPVGQMIKVDEGASLEQVVRALNMLGATPQDLMAILQAMKTAGALRAELEII